MVYLLAEKNDNPFDTFQSYKNYENRNQRNYVENPYLNLLFKD